MPNCPLTLRTVKGSKLTFNELDSNFLSLQNCINVVENNLNNLVNNTLNNRWHVPAGTTVTVNDGFQSFVYGDVYVEGLIELLGDSQLVVLNGDIILSGGTISGTGVSYVIDIPEYDSYVTGGTYNNSTQAIDFSGNLGFPSFSVNVSDLASDITVTGGVYDSNTGVITFTNSTGGTFNVSGFLTGYTNYYTTGATLNGTILEFDRTDLTNAYSVDLSPLKFTGNTALDCISDIHVSNIHSCSPLYINPNDEGNVYFGSTGILSVDLSNNWVGVGTSTPSEILDVNGKIKTTSLQITSGATNGYILTSDASGNAIWSSIYKKETVNIDSATILGTLSTGGTIQLLPAPSVGKYYDWHAFVKYTYGTVAYNNSGAGSWYVEQGGADLAYGFNLNALTTNRTWKASENSGGAAPIGNQGFETSAITIGVGSALTNGDGTISVDIYYRELNL